MSPTAAFAGLARPVMAAGSVVSSLLCAAAPTSGCFPLSDDVIFNLLGDDDSGISSRPGIRTSDAVPDNRRMEPRVAVAPIPLESTDGTFIIGRDTFPDFDRLARLGVHVQSDRVRVADPDPDYVQTALDALDEACRQLDIPEASIVFVDTVEPPPAFGLPVWLQGFVHDRLPDDHLGVRELDASRRASGGRPPRSGPPRVRTEPHRRGVSGSLRTVGRLRAGIRAP